MRRSASFLATAAAGLAAAALLALAADDVGLDADPLGRAAAPHARHKEGGAPPTLRGRAPLLVVPRTLEGTVEVEPEAGPRSVRVYLLPKSCASRADPACVTRPDAEGAWSLGPRDPAGHWICAACPGTAPAIVDGDAWSGEVVRLAPSTGRCLTLEVYSRQVPTGQAVRVRARARDEEACAWPGPGQCLPFERRETVLVGAETVFRVPTHGAVEVSIQTSGLRALPDPVRVSAECDYAELRLFTTALLDVEAVDAETGWDLQMEALVSLPGFELVDEVGETWRVENVDVHHFMNYMDWEGLPPGRYDVRITCEGYEPFAVDGVDLTRPGEVVEVRAALRLHPDAGRLDLRLDLPPGVTRGDHPPQVALCRLVDSRDRSRGWDWPRPRRVDPARSVLRLGPLVPGRYAVHAWVGTTWVGRGEATVLGGAAQSATVRLERGLLVDVVKLLAEQPAAGSDYLSFDLAAPDGDPLPAIRLAGLQPSGDTRDGGDDEAPWTRLATWCVPEDAVLGPYAERAVRVSRSGGDATWTWIVCEEPGGAGSGVR